MELSVVENGLDPEPDTAELFIPAPALRESWEGTVTPYVVGDPGHAATAVLERPAREAPDHHGIVLDGAVVRPDDEGPWTHVRGASVRGLRHRHDGTVRQDEYCFRQTTDDRYLVLAVADGVSAGSLSHEAAAVAARFGCEVVADWLATLAPAEVPWEHVLKTLSDLVEQRGRGVLRRRGVDVETWTASELAEELATTLVLAVVDLRPDDGAHRVQTVRVGDSSAWVLSGARPVGEPARHQERRCGDRLLGDRRAATGDVLRVRVARGRGGGGSRRDDRRDQRPARRRRQRPGRFLAEVWATPPSVLQFGAQVDFARKSFDDDRTAVAVWVGGELGRRGTGREAPRGPGADAVPHQPGERTDALPDRWGAAYPGRGFTGRPRGSPVPTRGWRRRPSARRAHAVTATICRSSRAGKSSGLAVCRTRPRAIATAAIMAS